MQTQLHVGKKPSPFKIVPVTRSELALKKPREGGFWTSTWNPESQSSGWTEWCNESGYQQWNGEDESTELNWWLLEPSKDARIYEIYNYNDFIWLLDWYEQEPLQEYSILWAGKKRPEFLRTLDFIKLAQDYDGLHLSEEGLYACHLSLDGPDLYGWDCESTLWFRWAFEGEPVKVK